MSRAASGLQAALGALRSGKPALALKHAQDWSASHPRDAQGYALAAQALLAMGREQQAQRAVARALRADGQFVPALLAAAEIARRRADHATRIRHLEDVTRLAPSLALGWLELSQALMAAGRLENAVAAARRATDLQPDLPPAQHVLGQLLLMLNDAPAALAAYEKALSLQPQNPHAAAGLAHALAAANAPAREQLAARQRAAELANSVDGWCYLAHGAWGAGEMQIARDALQRALQLDPDSLVARFGAMVNPHTAVFADNQDQRRHLEDFRSGLNWFESRSLDGAPPAVLEACITMASNFYLHYLGLDASDEQRRFAALIERMVDGVISLPQRRSRSPGKRLRIGFASGFFYRHTMIKLFGEMICGLDRDRFEIFLFHVDPVSDAVTEMLARSADHFLHGARRLGEWSAAIAEQDLDALVYLDIGMHPMIQGLAAQRLVERQLMLWGHPVSSGFANIDFFLTADAMEREEGETDYSEKVIRLPRLGSCFRTPDSPAQVPAELVETQPESVHYFLAQSAPKLVPRNDEILARVASAVPQARFCLTPSPHPTVIAQLRQRLLRCFKMHGLELDDHLALMRFVSEAEFLGIASRTDVNLDSLQWSGGNSTLEILGFDVPTVTLPGRSMRSRHTYAMLRLMELDALIASDVDDYIRIAVELGRSSDFREEMRCLIGERKHRLYEDRAVVHAFARTIVEVCEGCHANAESSR